MLKTPKKEEKCAVQLDANLAKKLLGRDVANTRIKFLKCSHLKNAAHVINFSVHKTIAGFVFEARNCFREEFYYETRSASNNAAWIEL